MEFDSMFIGEWFFVPTLLWDLRFCFSNQMLYIQKIFLKGALLPLYKLIFISWKRWTIATQQHNVIFIFIMLKTHSCSLHCTFNLALFCDWTKTNRLRKKKTLARFENCNRTALKLSRKKTYFRHLLDIKATLRKVFSLFFNHSASCWCPTSGPNTCQVSKIWFSVPKVIRRSSTVKFKVW